MAFIQQVFTVPSMVCGNSVTSSLELPGSYLFMYLQVPTMTSGWNADTKLFVQGSADNKLFYRYAEVLTNAVANDFSIASSTTQRMVFIPNFGMRFLKIETTAPATAGINSNTAFKIICVSNQ